MGVPYVVYVRCHAGLVRRWTSGAAFDLGADAQVVKRPVVLAAALFARRMPPTPSVRCRARVRLEPAVGRFVVEFSPTESRSLELTLPGVLDWLRLYWARRDEMRPRFRALSESNPAWAARVWREGLSVAGSEPAARHAQLRQAIDACDLARLFAAPEPATRAHAFRALSARERGNPTPPRRE